MKRLGEILHHRRNERGRDLAAQRGLEQAVHEIAAAGAHMALERGIDEAAIDGGAERLADDAGEDDRRGGGAAVDPFDIGLHGDGPGVVGEAEAVAHEERAEDRPGRAARGIEQDHQHAAGDQDDAPGQHRRAIGIGERHAPGGEAAGGPAARQRHQRIARRQHALAHRALHIGRQKGDDAHHRRAADEAGEIAVGDERIAPQMERQERLARLELAQNEEGDERGRGGQDRDQRNAAERGFLDERVHEGEDAEREERRAAQIDAARMPLHPLVQGEGEHPGGDEPQRHVDPEHPGPRPARDDERADDGTQDRGAAEHARDIALHPRAVGAAIDVAQQRLRHRHDRAGAESLDHAEHDQREHAPGEPAQDRAGEKEPDADEEEALAAVEIGEPAIDRHAHRLRQQIPGEDPAEEIEAAQRADDGRHGGGDDRALDRRHEIGRERRGEHPLPARGRDDDRGVRFGGLRRGGLIGQGRPAKGRGAGFIPEFRRAHTRSMLQSCRARLNAPSSTPATARSTGREREARASRGRRRRRGGRPCRSSPSPRRAACS